MLERLAARCVLLTQRIAFVGVAGMLFIAFSTIADVLLRWLFSAPIGGMGEVTSMALAVAVSACLPAGAAEGVNLTVDLLGARVAAKTVARLKLFGALVLLVFYALLAWRIGEYARSLQARDAVTVYLNIPTAPFMWTVAAFLASATLVQALVLARETRSAVLLFALIAAAAAAGFALHWGFEPLARLARSAPGATSLLVVVAVWLLLALYVPLAAALGLLGLLCAALTIGAGPAASVLGNETMQFLASAQVAVVPMFLMMGSFAVVAGMAEDIYDLAQALFAQLRGGLALATSAGCGGFGAVTGSSLATVATSLQSC